MDSAVNLLVLLAHAEYMKQKFPEHFHHYIEEEVWQVVEEEYEAAGGIRRWLGFLQHTQSFGAIIGINVYQQMDLAN